MHRGVSASRRASSRALRLARGSPRESKMGLSAVSSTSAKSCACGYVVMEGWRSAARVRWSDDGNRRQRQVDVPGTLLVRDVEGHTSTLYQCMFEASPARSLSARRATLHRSAPGT